MKKLIVIVLAAFLGMFAFLAFPRNAENSVVIKRNGKYLQVYENGVLKNIRTNENYEPLTVISYTYSYIAHYNFRINIPVKDRVMIKNNDKYDLEKSGPISLAKKNYCYLVKKDGKVSPADKKYIVLGKDTVKIYKDKKGNLNLFIVSPTNYENIMVGISTENFSSLYHKKIELNSQSTLNLDSLRDNFSQSVPAGSKIIIEKLGDKLSLTANGKVHYLKNRLYISGGKMTLTNIKRGQPTFNPSYSGTLEFTPSSKGVILVNELSLEDYLKGVIPSEMPTNYGIDALKCQAIAARTYAVSSYTDPQYGSMGCYLDDSTQSQVYNNFQDRPISNEAISETKGVIMTYKGEPLDAKYYSTSCGTGVSYDDVWFNADGTSIKKPYLTRNNYINNKPTLPKNESEWLVFFKKTNLTAIDSDSPYFRWNVSFSEQGMLNTINNSISLIYDKRKDFITVIKSKNFKNKTPQFTKIDDIKIVKRGENGNIKEIYIIGDGMELSIREDYTIRGILRCSSKYSKEATTINLKNDTVLSSSFLPSSFFSIEKQGTHYKIYGGGYGHGSGMSQYGAMYMSKNGIGYKDILNTYYKNYILTSIY